VTNTVEESADGFTPEELALIDDLTKLPNRRALDLRFVQEVRRAQRDHYSIALLMIDVDQLKQVNDKYGHLNGDAVLAELAAMLVQGLGEWDVASRYGEDEFALMLRETNSGALARAESIRARVAAATFPGGLKITISLGVAVTNEAALFADLITRAEGARVAAKRRGGNQVVRDLSSAVKPPAASSEYGGRLLDSSLYAENAFRVLSISTRADAIDIRRRAQALRLQAELDGDEQKSARLRNALGRLEDPSTRMEDELYWFTLVPDPIPEDLDPADESRVPAIIAELDRLSLLKSDQAADAAHDEAVLWHVRAIEIGTDGQPLWKVALAIWSNLWSNDRYWSRQLVRASELADARAPDRLIDQLRARLPERVLRATATKVAALLETVTDDEEAREALEAIRQSTFPRTAVSAARTAATEQLSGRLRDLLGEASKTFETVEVFKLTKLVKDRLNVLRAAAARLRALDPDLPQIEALVDEVADFLRRVAIRLYNESDDLNASAQLQKASAELAISDRVRTLTAEGLAILSCRKLVKKATTAADAGNWEAAVAALVEAHKIAPNDKERKDVDEFLRVCRFRESSDQAVALGEEGRWAEAAAAATVAHQLAFNDEQRKQLAGLAAYWGAAAARGAPTPRQVAEAASRRRRNGWIAAAVVGGLIILAIATNLGKSTGSGPSSTTSDVTASTTNFKIDSATQVEFDYLAPQTCSNLVFTYTFSDAQGNQLSQASGQSYSSVAGESHHVTDTTNVPIVLSPAKYHVDGSCTP